MLSMVKIRSKKRTRRARSPCDIDGVSFFGHRMMCSDQH